MSAPRITVSTLVVRRRVIVLGLLFDLLAAATLAANSGLEIVSGLQPGAVLAIPMVGSLQLLYLVWLFRHFIMMGASPWSYMGRLEKRAKFTVPVVAFILLVAGTPYWWWIAPVGLVWLVSIVFLWLSHRRVMRAAQTPSQ
jgi:hypothetical protein